MVETVVASAPFAFISSISFSELSCSKLFRRTPLALLCGVRVAQENVELGVAQHGRQSHEVYPGHGRARGPRVQSAFAA